MNKSELITCFQKLPCKHTIKIVNTDNDKFIIDYKFGSYGSRFIQLSKDDAERFYKKLDELYKCYHYINFAFKVDSSYVDELFDTVNTMITQESFDDLREFMQKYKPKTHPNDPFGKGLMWCRIGGVSEYCYAFECDKLRSILDIIGNIDNKYCRADFDYDNAMYPKHTRIGDLCCTEGNKIEMTLYNLITDYLEHNRFKDEEGHLERCWYLPRKKIDEIIKRYIKKLDIEDLVLFWI